MTQTEILWCAVTGAAVLWVAVHALVHALHHSKSGRRIPLLGMGRERDIFFIPGDNDDDDDDWD